MTRIILFAVFMACLALNSCSHAETAKTQSHSPSELCRIQETKSKSRQDSITLLVFGDSGSGAAPSEPQYRVAKAMEKICFEKKCDLALGLGDNFYEDGVKSKEDPQFQSKFEIPYSGLHFPFYMVLGNHDYHQNPRAQVEYSSARWKMPCEYYPVPTLPTWLSIFAFDTNQISQGQIEQAKKVLCDQKDWKVAIGHHPLYSSGSHGGDPAVNEKLAPLLKECHAQFLFSGHDHDQEHLEAPWIDQVVQGAAGKLRPIRTSAALPSGVRQKFGKSEFGFAIATFTKVKAQISFYNEQGSKIYEFERRSLSALGE